MHIPYQGFRFAPFPAAFFSLFQGLTYLFLSRLHHTGITESFRVSSPEAVVFFDSIRNIIYSAGFLPVSLCAESGIDHMYEQYGTDIQNAARYKKRALNYR
jgi:hypothetical protein